MTYQTLTKAVLLATFLCFAASGDSSGGEKTSGEDKDSRSVSKSIDMETMHLHRDQYRFGPLNATLNIAYLPNENIATYTLRYSMTAGRDGRVYQRSTRFGDTNGPWMTLQLLNSSGAVIAEKTYALAPVWECNTTTTGSRRDTISITQDQYDKVKGFKLIQASAWREEQC